MTATTQTPFEVSGQEVPIPHFLLELEDDASRVRMRDAFWASVMVHVLIVVCIALAPKYIRMPAQVALITPKELISNRELTYLDLPKDNQQVTVKPDSHIISDKDRVAVTRKPTLDKKTLDELRGRPGSPKPPGPPAPAPAPQPSAPAMAQASPPQQAQRSGIPQPPQQTAKLENVPESGALASQFNRKFSPGASIDQAVQAAASNRIAGGGGASGDYSVGFGLPKRQVLGGAEIISDTMGVDFAPYLSRLRHDVERTWYAIIPEAAKPPLMKSGRVIVEFAITRQGQIAGMRLVGPSGDVSLDRAAWGGITGANPFPPLPSSFHGDYIALRFYFYYNPDQNEMR